MQVKNAFLILRDFNIFLFLRQYKLKLKRILPIFIK